MSSGWSGEPVLSAAARKKLEAERKKREEEERRKEMERRRAQEVAAAKEAGDGWLTPFVVYFVGDTPVALVEWYVP